MPPGRSLPTSFLISNNVHLAINPASTKAIYPANQMGCQPPIDLFTIFAFTRKRLMIRDMRVFLVAKVCLRQFQSGFHTENTCVRFVTCISPQV
jgi:hypothetical protein